MLNKLKPKNDSIDKITKISAYQTWSIIHELLLFLKIILHGFISKPTFSLIKVKWKDYFIKLCWLISHQKMPTNGAFWINFSPLINTSLMKNMQIRARQLNDIFLLLEILKANSAFATPSYHHISNFLNFGKIGLLRFLTSNRIYDSK